MSKTEQEGGDTTRRAADSLWALQRKIDGATIPGVRVGTRGSVSYPARYAATKEPPTVKAAHYYSKAREMYKDQAHLPEKPQVVLPFGQEDIAAMEAKDKMALQLEFDRWITDNFQPWGNPVWAEWLKNKYPGYFEARVSEMKNLHELQKQWQEIRIRGAQSIEDLYLMWRVSADEGLQRRLTGGNALEAPRATGEYLPTMFNQGIWNRRSYTTTPDRRGVVSGHISGMTIRPEPISAYLPGAAQPALP
jgi:hypothetical protein